MTPPSTQNLALGLWVFFLICCSTISFLLNVGYRLTLGFLTISPSSESRSFTLVHIGVRLPKTSVRKTEDFRFRGQIVHICVPVTKTNHQLWSTCWENRGEKHRGDLTRMRTEPNPYKRITPPSTQNLKALGLWVFFPICCSTISFLLNVGLRLTLGFLTTINSN